VRRTDVVVNPNGVSGAFASASGVSLWTSDLGPRTSDLDATAEHVTGRYPTVDALAADVRSWLDGAAVSAYAEPPWERVVRFYRRNSALVLLLLAYLAVRLFILRWRGV
jgi:hypothetical protein